MDKKKDLIQMLEKIQNPNHLAMVYGFVKRMYLEEQKERVNMIIPVILTHCNI